MEVNWDENLRRDYFNLDLTQKVMSVEDLWDRAINLALNFASIKKLLKSDEYLESNINGT